MGNKNSSGPPEAPVTEAEGHREEAGATDGVSGRHPSRGGGLPAVGPSPELLASLQALGEHSDYTLLPQSLHQIAETYSLEEDYQWAVEFLHLEKLYHERLLANLAALQENWETQWRERNHLESKSCTNSISQEHIEKLSQICKTHQRPTFSMEKRLVEAGLNDIKSTQGPSEGRDTTLSRHNKVNTPFRSDQERKDKEDEDEERNTAVASQPSTENLTQEEEEEDEEDEEEEEGQEADEGEVFEETPEGTPEEEVRVEWPTGVPQASVKDLAKLSHAEGSSSPDGLVSILKRRRASLDGLPPSGPVDVKQSSKRKVRFSEPQEGVDQDEVGGDSCLILLFLCLVTVVISVGGTALYCALVDTYSNICTDFSHNVEFYVVSVRRFVDQLRSWLPMSS